MPPAYDTSSTQSPPQQLPGIPTVPTLEEGQLVPAGAAGLEQAPVAGSQVPATWHRSSGWQTTGSPGRQRPPWQVSPIVQASPPSQARPSASAVVQAPAAQ